MSRGFTLSDLYSGETLNASELEETTRVVVTTPWGLLGPAPLGDIRSWLANRPRIDIHSLTGSTVTATLDANAQRAFVLLDPDATFEITNDAALPLGYEVIIDCYGAGQTLHLGGETVNIATSSRLVFVKMATYWLHVSMLYLGEDA